jgi:hypothetical protein
VPVKVIAAERLGRVPMYRFRDTNQANALCRRGINYEAKVEAMLRAALPAATIERGSWFRYRLQGGLLWRFCQPDFIIHEMKETDPEGVKSFTVTVAECKLTWRSQAVVKLHTLYLPVVQIALGLPSPPLAMQICSNVNRQYAEWQALEDRPHCALLHWRGDGFRVPRAKKAKKRTRRAA